MIEYLSLEDLLSLVGDLGVGPLRDIGLLDSAAHRPQVSVLGEDAYPGIHEKAAVLLESLVRNHPLVDGNKRLGWLATVVFYGLNGVTLEAPDDDAYDLVIAVASGESAYPQSAIALESWTLS
ncbi:type II toxin-antitoxin system death-on-curing family toxin [Tessaracoccus palaemonis]|uniref:Type II toxin-antitoxin system death-on-curing family toxin n=1 Tax=Tessaracoccus palaemonis TaxID=2829499 RepID=A0ABX8SI00_9ACTN|nr:type II toxin-antitoxin system death-on-curing family toxin [Tessaracoccus palaemonis]QXT62930.1 type II toxin-antitoxin system death-on-curing family toxin [Tessaracoccus palaemonis]